MRIGLDFDGVLSDCGRLKELAAQEMFGVVIPRERFKKELVVGAGILSMEQYLHLQDVIYGTREYGLRMEPVPGMIENLNRLLAAGHEAQVISSRSGPTLAVAQEWLERQGLRLQSTGVGLGVSKAEAASGLDAFVDDDLDKLEPLVGVVPHRFLFSWGYNDHVDIGATAARVASWRELHDALELLAGRK